MTVPVEAVQPVEQTGQTEELHMVQPTDNEVDMFQKGFAQYEVNMQQTTMHGMSELSHDQMGIVTSNIQAARGLLTRDD